MNVKTAKAIVYVAPEKVELREFDLPEVPDDDETIIEIEAAGIDGSEVKMYLGEFEFFNNNPPITMGDELVGRVCAIGTKAAERRNLKVGDRVTVETSFPCGECDACHAGQYYLCDKGMPNRSLGWTPTSVRPLMGAYATHVRAHKDMLIYKIPEDMPTDVAIMCVSVFANSLRWAGERSQVGPGSKVLIIGPGPQGIMAGLASKILGADKVVMVGTRNSEDRLKMSLRMGCDTTFYFDEDDLESKIIEALGGRPDTVIESSGVTKCEEFAIQIVKKMGRVNFIGVGFDPLPVDVSLLMSKEIMVFSSLAHPFPYIDKAIETGYKIWKDGKYPIEEMVTHKFSLEEADLALRTAAKKVPGQRPVKTVLYPKAAQ